MTLKAVFLDVGHTLIHEVPSRFEIYAGIAHRRGLAVEVQGMEALMRRTHDELPLRIDGAYRYSDRWFEVYIERVFVEGLELAPEKLADVQDELFATFEAPETFRVYPGAFELFAEVRRLGLRLGVISNWSTRLPRVLDGLGLSAAFDFVLCSALEELEKPDPAIFRAALERAGVDAEHALHAGDHPENDVAAAARVGLEGVLVDHAGRYAGRPRPGTFRAAGLDELAAHLSSRT